MQKGCVRLRLSVRPAAAPGAVLGMIAALGAAAVFSASAAVAAPMGSMNPGTFPFHNGDRVVFLGDSITEQRLYTTYLETYLLTRFPTWKLQFRNAGWGGDTSYLRTRGVPSVQALQRDVLDLNPTVVTIDFGMNDAGYGGFNQDLYDKHYQGEKAIVRQLKAAGVRPVVLTASAVEKSDPGDNAIGYNQTLAQFGAGDRMIAAAEGVPFADQLHPFSAAINRLRATQPTGRLSGDAVHPGPAGHLMMADFILTGLNAPPVVSSATVDARTGRVGSTEGAHIMDVVRTGGGVTFRRLDDALVFPIEPSARPVLQIVPVAQDLDRYMLRVPGLNPGEYQVAVNDSLVATFSAAQLSDGVNLAYYDSPLSAPGMEILRHVYSKNNAYFDVWRNVRLKDSPDKTTREQDFSLRIADEEKQIDALRVPQVYRISVMPVPMEKAPPPTDAK